MADFNVRSDSVDVEQIMEQIRARIREKRGVDYTEQQIRELAAVKLEKFLDPRGVRSDLLEQFRKAQPAYTPPELPNYAFEDQTLYESTRPLLRWIRRILNPILKLFFNPNPLIQALHIQSRLNGMYGEREARREATRRAFDQLQYELMHNLVVETTRLSIEVKNLKMRVESLASRLEFNERRARALESVVVYKPSAEERAELPAAGANQARDARYSNQRERELSDRRAVNRAPSVQGPQDLQARPEQRATPGPGQNQAVPVAPSQSPSTGATPGTPGEGPGQRSRRRRRRRGRRGGGAAAAIMGGNPAQSSEAEAASSDLPDATDETPDSDEPREPAQIEARSEEGTAPDAGPDRGHHNDQGAAGGDHGDSPGPNDKQ